MLTEYLCARIGREEFCIVMPDATMDAAMVSAERIRLTLAQTRVHHREKGIATTASLGVAEWRPGEAGIEPALARADRAPYQAERAGRNQVVAKPRTRDRRA